MRGRFGVRMGSGALVSLLLAATPGAPATAQSLGDVLRRAVEQTVRDAARPPSPPASPASQEAAPAVQSAPVPNPDSAVQPGATSTSSAPGVTIQALEQRFANGPRTVDLRNGTPPELANRFLPEKGLIILSNPYAPADRRFLEKATAMACHPQGGLVLYAYSERYNPSSERGPGREYEDNGTGLWRVESDGRVRPIAVRLGRERASSQPLCGVPIAGARALAYGTVSDIAIEPNGDLLVADSTYSAILRYRGDGNVERVAGGGAGVCTADVHREHAVRGHRDGPGRDALFSGELSIAVNARAEIFVLEGDASAGGQKGNCTLRRIAPGGEVSTIHGNGVCEPYATTNRTGYRTPGYERVAVDASGRPMMMGSHRAMREGTGPDVVYTKVHRIDQGREEMLGRAGHGARFDPVGRLVAVGTAPDGTPLAFNAGYYSDAGLVVLENGPQFRYWWRSAPGAHSPVVDGPRGQAVIQNASDFCTGADGYVYVLAGNAVRRIDPRSGEVSTWLH